jgi:hypothetical protein
MCKGAHKTHKRSGAQAQAKRLIPRNGIKGIKIKRPRMKKGPRDCLKGTQEVMNLKQKIKHE